jgi:hypothetical protein
MSLDRARRRGDRAVADILRGRPKRRWTWAKLSSEDQEILALWVGLPGFPPLRRNRKAIAAEAIDNGADETRLMIHERQPLPRSGMWGGGPFS